MNAHVDPAAGPPGPAARYRGPGWELLVAEALPAVRALPPESADCCYLDPPFFTGRRRRGRKGTGFDDVWPSQDEYLAAQLAVLHEVRRVLRPTGNLLVHVDARAVHALKVELDRLYGAGDDGRGRVRPGFRNEIIWRYASGGRGRRALARKHDTILWYSRGADWYFDPAAGAPPRGMCPYCGAARARWNHLKREVDGDGRVARTVTSHGRVYRYYDDQPASPSDVWTDISHLHQRDPERTGYPTQKPLALLERLVEMFCPPGGLLIDPMCGSGTALVAARRRGRRAWGGDRNPEAVALAVGRLGREA